MKTSLTVLLALSLLASAPATAATYKKACAIHTALGDVQGSKTCTTGADGIERCSACAAATGYTPIDEAQDAAAQAYIGAIDTTLQVLFGLFGGRR